MSRLHSLPCTVALLAAVASGLPSQSEAGVRALRVVELDGTPAERGEKHGATLAPEIRALVGRWHEHLGRTHGMSAPAFTKAFLAQTRFPAAIDRWTPGLMDEVRGIAKGAGVAFESILLLNLIDEVWAQGGRTVAHKCTSVGVSRQGAQPPIVAQNLDVPRLFHGTPTLLKIREPSGARSMVVTLPGLIGANGMNSHGVGVAVNTVLQLRPRPDGLPVAFVVRGLLQRESFQAARAFLYDVEHASGQNYILGGSDRAHSFECSAQRVVRCLSHPTGRHTWHTNHPLLSRDWNPEHVAKARDRGLTPRAALAPCPRYAELARRFGEAVTVTPAEVEGVLASRRGRPPIDNASTLVSTVMLLGRKPRMRIRIGGQAATAYVDHLFSEAAK